MRAIAYAELAEALAQPTCPFCFPKDDRVVAKYDNVMILRDGYPLNNGHLLFVPNRHVARVQDLGREEWYDILCLLKDFQQMAAALLDPKPDGFTIGINDGEAAGQTIPHVHVHLIPRYKGDTANPRGGIRWVIPEKAAYWKEKA